MTAVSVVLGACVWVLVPLLSHRPTPLQSGALYLTVLGAAGFLIALVERELSWGALLGIYAGQVLALGTQAILGHGIGDEPAALQVLYLLSANLSTAVGGVVGLIAASWLRGSNSDSPAK